MSKDWRISLASRNKLFYNDIPYVPILVENIYTYVAFEDHEKNGVKTIQTMGQLVPKTGSRATLVSLTPGNNTVFPISLKILNVDDVYIEDSNQAYFPIWVSFSFLFIFTCSYNCNTTNFFRKNILYLKYMEP